MVSISFVLLFSHMLIRISSTSANSYCSVTGNFTANSTYAKSLSLVLSSLPSNTSTANGLFYNTSTGQGADRVHVLSLCRADSSSENCSACVDSRVQEMMEQCPNQKEAYSWYGDPPCIVRYSNRPLGGILKLLPTDAGYNINNITADMEVFDQTWGRLMVRVLTKASTGSSKLKFATGNTNLTEYQKIYTIMQCTPDLSQNDCRDCLQDVVRFFNSCCYGRQGGYVHKPSCFFRWDLYPFYDSSLDDPSLPPSSMPLPRNPEMRDKKTMSSRTIIIIVVTTTISVVLLVLSCCLLQRKKARQQEEEEMDTMESLQYGFGTIKAATNNFSDENKLGKGGFGIVYKGKLSDGQDVAVKRLSKDSGQGEHEFKNEVLVMAKLQHKNLVRFIGFCSDGAEKLLIYELVDNSSLDNYIFDRTKHQSFGWEKRYRIIGGTARGLLYLHEESQLRIIHRDLKASNILLDAEMNAKISDFGMARLFMRDDQIQGDTSRIVGTFGYMAPEYVTRGHYSVKSDVFSFGVLVLEIICGQRNSAFSNGHDALDLLTYAWKNWTEGTVNKFIDPSLGDGCKSEIMRCIHMGLLCVQENEADRPTMAMVVLMLSSESITINVPSKPAFFMHGAASSEDTSSLEF